MFVNNSIIFKLITLISMCISIFLTGCSTLEKKSKSVDPFEHTNRIIYKFNDKLDRNIAAPITNLYTNITPRFARQCICNFFNNIDDLWSAFNCLLQGRGLDGANSMGRFVLNTTMGIGGLLDIASANGSFKVHNDFGITLAVWGLNQGPYIVLPLLGPSCLCDSIGLVGSIYVTKLGKNQIPNDIKKYIKIFYILNEKEKLNNKTAIINKIALDKYSLVRDSYLQYRRSIMLDKSKESSILDYKN